MLILSCDTPSTRSRLRHALDGAGDDRALSDLSYLAIIPSDGRSALTICGTRVDPAKRPLQRSLAWMLACPSRRESIA